MDGQRQAAEPGGPARDRAPDLGWRDVCGGGGGGGLLDEVDPAVLALDRRLKRRVKERSAAAPVACGAGGAFAGPGCRRLAAGDSKRAWESSLDDLARGCLERPRDRYRAWRADSAAISEASDPSRRSWRWTRGCAAKSSVACAHWSPQQIAARLISDYPDDLTMRVSHETIYRTLFIQARGALRKELTACLRTGRAQRRPHMRTEQTGVGRLRNMILISERPPEVEDRAVPGHWEGDLIIGKGGRSAIGTLVERSSRYVVLLHLPHGRSAEDVRAALDAAGIQAACRTAADPDVGSRQRDG